MGTDIIYKLSCVQDFKQDMLVTAVKDGLMEVGGRGWERVGGARRGGRC